MTGCMRESSRGVETQKRWVLPLPHPPLKRSFLPSPLPPGKVVEVSIFNFHF